MSALRTEDLTDGSNVVGGSDEGREDHVDAVLDAEREVLLVLLGESGQVDGGLGEVDALAGGEGAVVDGLDAEAVALDGEDLEGEDSVVDVDELARGGDLDDVGLEGRA